MADPRLFLRLGAPLCALFIFAAASAIAQEQPSAPAAQTPASDQVPAPATPLPAPVPAPNEEGPRQEAVEEGGDGETRLHITADSIVYAEGEGVLVATGNTSIKYGQFAITGQQCTIERASRHGLIEGDVRLQVQNADIRARSMDFSLDTGTGTLEEARGSLGGSLSFTASRIERREGNRFIIEDGSLTSCPVDNQEWVFKARRLDVRMEGLALFEDVSLRFYGVPVFYSPYWFAPAVTKRTSGFLLPGIGFSSTGGATIKNSLFWAISDQDDATLYFDWMDKRGTREGLEYRYAFAERTTGKMNLDYLYDRRLNEPLYGLQYEHRMKFNEYADSMARADIESRTSYSKEFDNSTYMRTRRYTDSYANVHFTGGPYSLSLTGRDQRELEATSGEILGKRPELLLAAMPQYLGGVPVVAEGSATATSFYATRYDTEAINRFNIRPRLSLPFDATPFFNVTPWVEGRSTWYSRNALDKKSLAVGYYAAGASIEGPRIYRIFASENEAWKHSITPRVDYLYIPGYEVNGTERQNALALDALDKNAPTSLLSLSLLNRVYSRARADEIVRLNVSQGYDFREALRKDIAAADKRPWGGLTLELKSRPAEWILLNADLVYSHYEHRPIAMNQEVGFNWGDFHLSYDRRFVDSPRETFSSGLLGYRFNNAFSAEASAIYNEERHEAVGSLLTVNWESCCWGLSLNAGSRRRTEQLASGDVRSEVETRFFFNIFLKGIGDIGERSIPLIERKIAPGETPSR